MKKERQYIDYFSTTMNNKYTYSDIILRLDLIGIIGCFEKIPLNQFVGQIWTDFFPKAKYDNEIGQICNSYYEDCRLGFIIISRNDHIKSTMQYLRILISTAILNMLDDKCNDFGSIKRIRKEVCDYISIKEDDIFRIRNLTNNFLDQYYSDRRISIETLSIIKSYKHYIESILGKLYDGYPSKKKNTPSSKNKNSTISIDPSDERTYSENRNSILWIYRKAPSLLYGCVFCLLYCSILDDNEKLEREALIRKHWRDIFKTTPYSKSIQIELNNYIDNDLNLKSMDSLFKYPLIELKNGRIVRSIAVSVCVHKVLSVLPSNTEYDIIVDEALSLFSRFTALSVGREEKDIEKLLKRYLAEEGVIDKRISTLMWEQEKNISKFYDFALDCINSTGSARERNWWEEILEKKKKDYENLHTQIGSTKISAIYDLVEKLSGPSYNYVLSRLYRYAYGFDDIYDKDLITNLKIMMQVFNLFGVTPTNEDLINKNIADSDITEDRYIKTYVSGISEGVFAFPGWDVGGDTVIHPILSKDMGDKE